MRDARLSAALSLKLRRITSAVKSKHQSSWEDHKGRLVADFAFFSVGSSFNQAENHGTSMLLNHQKSSKVRFDLRRPLSSHEFRILEG